MAPYQQRHTPGILPVEYVLPPVGAKAYKLILLGSIFLSWCEPKLSQIRILSPTKLASAIQFQIIFCFLVETFLYSLKFLLEMYIIFQNREKNSQK